MVTCRRCIFRNKMTDQTIIESVCVVEDGKEITKIKEAISIFKKGKIVQKLQQTKQIKITNLSSDVLKERYIRFF